MTLGPRMFQAFGWAGLLFAVSGAVLECLPRGEGAFLAFGALGVACFVAGAVVWVACWLIDLMKPWGF